MVVPTVPPCLGSSKWKPRLYGRGWMYVRKPRLYGRGWMYVRKPRLYGRGWMYVRNWPSCDERIMNHSLTILWQKVFNASV